MVDNTAKNRKLHKFPTTNSNFGINVNYFRHESWCNVHVYLFSAKLG